MSSNNFLTVKTQLSEFKTSSDKDTVSEASESGTSNSVTSAEDLQKLAVILGLNSAEDVYQERFRVDRRRLEAMLSDNLEETQTAQAFFHRVMNETNTLVNWPARLKIGARSKKDPHVRVAGRPDDVKLAREKIMQLLDTRSNRVTMKIDVSYTDHSHIIGKGGLTIKRVMEETGCHIHFPDSNRTSALEKSNQVSIAGDMERVERARARVRALTPLVFTFELPVGPASQPLPDVTSPVVQQIQEQYNVQVMLRNRPKLHANLVVVKGVQWEVKGAMEATTLLMDYMCGSLASQTQVQMTVEISPMHHSAVVGRGSEQLKAIMKGTGALVMFPDATDPNTPPIKKSCVTISGRIHDVYKARQQLVGCLPLVVIFDVSDAMCRIENDTVAKLMSAHNVYINIRRKPKQGITSVVIKGIERCAGDIYEARRSLLGGTEPAVTAEIPSSFSIPALGPPPPPPALHAFNMFNMASPCSPFSLPLSDLGYNMGSPLYSQPHPHTPTGVPVGHPSPQLTPPVYPPWLLPSPPPRAQPLHYPSSHGHNLENVMYANQGDWNPMSGGEVLQLQPGAMGPPPYAPAPPPAPHPAHPHAHAHAHAHDTRPASAMGRHVLNTSGAMSAGSSGYHSNFTGSTASLDTHNNSLNGGGDGSNVASPSVSPISKHSANTGHSPAPSSDTDRSQQEIASIISEVPLSERRAPGCEKKTLETLNKMSPRADYTNLKAEANKAMRSAVGSGYRVPTPRWAGYYFSHTSPGPINLDNNDKDNHTPEKTWNRSELVRPNIVESAPSPSPPRAPAPAPAPPAPAAPPCRYQQLYDLLRDIGLQKYIELFSRHEVDLSTFASLSEADLAEIGVAAFGARRKMLLLIQELQNKPGALKERTLLGSPHATHATHAAHATRTQTHSQPW